MLNVNLITVGKLKESYLRDACAEYAKRLSAFCRLNIVELNESRLPDSPSEKEIKAALNIPEEHRLMSVIPVGKSAYKPREKAMKPMDEVLEIL